MGNRFERELDGHTLRVSVTSHEGGNFQPVILVSHPEKGQIREFPLQGFRHGTASDAEQFGLDQLQAVTGVSQDGSLKFR